LIKLTLKIKYEVAPHKNEHNQSLTRWGRASIHNNKPLDARSALLRRQVRKSRYWFAFAGDSDWRGSAELSSQEQLDLSRDLLRNLEGTFLTLQSGGICPLTKAVSLNRALCLRPVLSIRQLAEEAIVSESTAKRWLKALEKRGVLSSVLKDGQRQYVNDGLVEIIEKYV
jgi:DNA-binding transcriptional ArsR family regulator